MNQTRKIFLASSLELKGDREKFEQFIGRKNKTLNKNSCFLELVIWEDSINAMSKTRSQDEYNRLIHRCDIFVMLFATKVGCYTNEEFESAFKHFKETGKPWIYIFRKTVMISSDDISLEDMKSVLDFQKRLKEIEHFHAKYKNIDDLINQFNRQLELRDPHFWGKGNLESLNKTELKGSGAIAQGEGAMAAGKGAVLAGGNISDSMIVTGDKNSIHSSKEEVHSQTYTKNIYYESSNKEKKQHQSSRKLYLASLRDQCQCLPLMALGGDGGAEEDITLDNVYIDLDTTTQLELKNKGKSSKAGAFLGEGENKKPLSALEAVRKSKKVVLLGDPGSGKSTFVKMLAARIAQDHLNGEGLVKGFSESLIPVFMELRQFSPRLRRISLEGLSTDEAQSRLINVFQDQLKEALERLKAVEFYDELQDALLERKCLLILDGLDEVPFALRVLVHRLVNALQKEYRFERLIITCRIRSYSDANRFENYQSHTLAAFEVDKIKRFVIAWYNRQQELGRVDAYQSKEKSESLINAATSDSLRELSQNPMMLTTMAMIHQREVGLPKERVRLYSLAVDIFLRRWQRQKLGDKGLSISQELSKLLDEDLKLRKIMERLAYEAHCSGKEESQAADLPRSQAVNILEGKEYLKDLSLSGEFLDYIDQHSGLLVGRGGELNCPVVYGFPHRTFQEYLAGCYLIRLRDLTRKLFGLTLEKDYWSQTVQMGFEELRFNRLDDNKLLELAYQLNSSGDNYDNVVIERARLWSSNIAVLLGKDIVTEDNFPDGGGVYLKRLNGQLKGLLRSNLSARERSEAGVNLARLGDDRSEVMTVEGMEFCYIPGGPFWMGSAENDKLAYDDEKPQHLNKDLKEGYWISRYPVSNAQYQEFIEAGGYKSSEFWLEAQREGYWKNGQVKGRIFVYKNNEWVWGEYFFQESPYDYGAPYVLPNHPVVGINWFEALAFSRWLMKCYQKKGWLSNDSIISLPSESHWEKAARGGEMILESPWIRNIVDLQMNKDISLVKNQYPKGRYPWGGEADPHLANYHETGIGSTSTLGCFLDGASPYGCEELNGNVWEWYSDWFDENRYRNRVKGHAADPKSGSSRVLRGGGWRGTARDCRSAGRRWDYPGFRFRNLGFRLMRT